MVTWWHQSVKSCRPKLRHTLLDVGVLQVRSLGLPPRCCRVKSPLARVSKASKAHWTSSYTLDTTNDGRMPHQRHTCPVSQEKEGLGRLSVWPYTAHGQVRGGLIGRSSKIMAAVWHAIALLAADGVGALHSRQLILGIVVQATPALASGTAHCTPWEVWPTVSPSGASP